ncbi:2-(1,2-epoxy-1,2-dihydrophenyl)acetyl-CoA isomerase [Nocardioides humilatus]|uniref:2-(1,2-epoxy-1,2-dihydrophenyl)acetyl-CoA isomerase n=1 Tax=Nocardioides humilatus TaxID=2607660 RepID=A0A5B1LPA2_9ACTN|nr:enoyl-CoA hydratase-related protein [Nocardioides humilatus]KAA1421878.1 2-(1,2-epoxy-1,2-dihydrophenyl)acetyl-CoA isomerase [Nocardioides humilatus]
MDADNHLLCERHDAGYAVVTLNRPERFNALNHALVADLRELLAKLEAEDDVRAIVLTGAGRAFCAGADLKAGPSDVEDVIRRLYIPLVEQIEEMRTPIIAAVNGAAAGAGFSLALNADLRLASTNASFSMSFVKVGLVPDAGATWLLPRIVGASRAAEIALLGRKVTAEQALTWNLVNDVVPQADLHWRASAIAAELAALPASVGQVRALLHTSGSATLAEQLDAEAIEQGRAQQHPHFAEAKQSFVEKREPRFW